MFKGLLNSEKFKQDIVIIGVDQLLSNNAFNEHICLENIKNYTNRLENMMINSITR